MKMSIKVLLRYVLYVIAYITLLSVTVNMCVFSATGTYECLEC